MIISKIESYNQLGIYFNKERTDDTAITSRINKTGIIIETLNGILRSKEKGRQRKVSL